MKRVILFMMFCITALYSTAQDVGFSQFYDQPLLRNPALAGIFTGDVRFSASYRNQWESVTIPYRTFGLSTEVKTPINITQDDNLTFGLQLIRDIAGTSDFSTLQILPAINYSLPLSKVRTSYLSVGFMGGIMQQRFDPTKLVMNDQFVAGSNGSFSILPSTQQIFNRTAVNYFDISTGISYNGAIREQTDYFVGIGMFHITSPKVGFYDNHSITLNKKLAFNAGLSVPTSEADRFVLYADHFRQYDTAFKSVGSTFQAGFLFRHDLFVMGDDATTISGGLLYRLNDAIIPVVQLQLNKFMIGLSYDVNIDKLATAARYRGGFEVILSYRDFLNNSQSERRQVMCPGFRH